MQPVTSCIHRVPIFRALPPESVARLQQAMYHRTVAPAEVLVGAGEPVTRLIVVAEGLLKLSRTSRSGREQVLRELGPGDFYGELALFAEVESEGDLTAVVKTEACILDRAAVQAEMARVPQLAVPLVAAVAERLARAERTIGELALFDVGERLAAELLRLAEREGGAAARFELPMPWAQLAAKLGTTPESLSRRLRDFAARGWIRVDGRQVELLDVAALRRLVD